MPHMNVGDTKVHYEVHGSGEPLLLITGLCGDLTSWKKALPLLDREFEVITIDNRGAGKTEHPGRPFTMEDLADDSSGLLEGLGIKKAHVLGASMGGNVAQELTLRHPEQVYTLTLMSKYMRRPERSSRSIAWLRTKAAWGRYPGRVSPEKRRTRTFLGELDMRCDRQGGLSHGWGRYATKKVQIGW